MNKVMMNQKGAELYITKRNNEVVATLFYNGFAKQWHLSGSMNTTVKVFKARGFKVVESN